MQNLSVFLLVGLLPVVVVGLEHKGVARSEHGVANPPDEQGEGHDGPVLPDGPTDNHNAESDSDEPE